MEGSIKENPSKFRIRDKVFCLFEKFFFFFLSGRAFRVSNNANSSDTFA